MTGLANRIIKGSFLSVSNLVLTILVTFFMMPFIIEAIGDRWYGLWVLATTFIGYYGFLDLGLSTAIPRFISRAIGQEDYTEVNKVFNTCMFLFCIAGLLVLVISIIITIVTPRFVNDPTDIYVFRIITLIIGITIAVSFPTRAFQGFLFAHIRYDIINIFEIIKLSLRTALIVVVLSKGYGLIALALVSLCSEVLQYVATIVFAKKRYHRFVISLSYFAKDKIRVLLNYGLYSFISNVANQLRFHTGAFVITVFLGLSFVTHFNIGARVATYYLMIINSMTALMMPVFSRIESQDNYDQIREKFVFVTKLNTILSVFLGGTIFIYGKAFIMRWMGEDYLDSYNVLFILTIGLIFTATQFTSKTLLYSLYKHKVYAITLLCEGAANLILSLILVRTYGILGVAMGTTIPTIFVNIFVIPIYANKVINLPLFKYVKVVLAGMILGSAIHVCSYLVIKDFILSSYHRIILLGAVTTLIFISLNIFILLNKDERRYFKIPI